MSHAPEAAPTESARLCQEALTAAAEGRWADAENQLTELVRLIPNDDGLWTTLATVHLGAGAVDKAMAAGERAIELMPVSHAAWSVLADAYAAAGLWEEALGAAQQQFELKPYLPEGLYKAAVAYVQLDEPEGAIRALEAALSQRRSLREQLIADDRFAALREQPGYRLLID